MRTRRGEFPISANRSQHFSSLNLRGNVKDTLPSSTENLTQLRNAERPTRRAFRTSEGHHGGLGDVPGTANVHHHQAALINKDVHTLTTDAQEISSIVLRHENPVLSGGGPHFLEVIPEASQPRFLALRQRFHEREFGYGCFVHRQKTTGGHNQRQLNSTSRRR